MVYGMTLSLNHLTWCICPFLWSFRCFIFSLHVILTCTFLEPKTHFTHSRFWGSWRLSESHLITNMREEHRLRVLEWRVLRKIFRPEEIRGDCRKMRNEKLHTSYCSSTIGWLNQQNGSAGLGAHTGQRRGAYGILVGKTGGKKPLGWPRCRWEW